MCVLVRQRSPVSQGKEYTAHVWQKYLQMHSGPSEAANAGDLYFQLNLSSHERMASHYICHKLPSTLPHPWRCYASRTSRMAAFIPAYSIYAPISGRCPQFDCCWVLHSQEAAKRDTRVARSGNNSRDPLLSPWRRPQPPTSEHGSRCSFRMERGCNGPVSTVTPDVRKNLSRWDVSLWTAKLRMRSNGLSRMCQIYAPVRVY